MPATLVVHEGDPADAIWELAGDLSEVDIYNNKVLVGVYKRGNEQGEYMTPGGVIVTHKTTDEDQYQSKVGLVLKIGPIAFMDMAYDPPRWFVNQHILEGDWVVYRPSDGWSLSLISGKGKLLCRLLDDTSIMAKVDSPLGPDRVY
jgi:hypothetical protein